MFYCLLTVSSNELSKKGKRRARSSTWSWCCRRRHREATSGGAQHLCWLSVDVEAMFIKPNTHEEVFFKDLKMFYLNRPLFSHRWGANLSLWLQHRLSHSHTGACLPALSCVCTPVTVQINTTDSCVLSSLTVKRQTDLKQRLRMKRQRRKRCNWRWGEKQDDWGVKTSNQNQTVCEYITYIRIIMTEMCL